MSYANRTSVSVARSRGEIESLLVRFGCDRFTYTTGHEDAAVAFEYGGRMIRFDVRFEPKENFRRTPGGRRTRSDEDTAKAWEQAQREKWRALALTIKAVLVAVETEIWTFEQAFHPWTVMPDGKTLFEHCEPKVAKMVTTGRMPTLALGP